MTLLLKVYLFDTIT